MRYRKLRIAFSATCLIACVLLIVLWVLSYWWVIYATRNVDDPRIQFKSQTLVFSSGLGILGVSSFPTLVWPHTYGWRMYAAAASAPELQPMTRSGFYWESSPTRYICRIPHWLPVVSLVVLTAVPWIRQLNWRFSLRTLLIATTLIAVVLGLIVAMLR